MKEFEILNSGPLTLIQDSGRYGYQKSGVPVSGAMDSFSYKVANMLLGNNENEAVLEFTMLGPKIKFRSHCTIAITGGESFPKVNGNSMPTWESIKISPEDELSFSIMGSGCRGYISFSGGIDVPEIMGSRSTYMKARIGGFEGRQLKSGDILKLKNLEFSSFEKKLPQKYKPLFSDHYELRVILGPQDDYFTPKGIDTFLSKIYNITNECDRMGVRLEGEKIEHVSGGDILSDGIVAGSIQVPGHGKPIIMMADCQTTGGYTKIATVISSDLKKLAQARPGDTLSFKEITVEDGQRILREDMEIMKKMKNEINSRNKSLGKTFRIKVNSKIYNIEVFEV
ncbi:biotin-dependent carboxyltransferase family protein [uncultured Ilyobacter sp.]|uniref:5-oxoprolinase subunit C family protein n=1 Tax=uncultured Ilyobacter sp. TaxID=544433 RepID=UPI0029C95713|nr:biotin-dependent carboxyltransferase family protein [uncultured Ilyobacter sp.]